MDVLTPEQRRLNMSRIRGKDTSPEMIIRRALHGRGFRYRLHDKRLPGKPDLVFPKYRAVLLIHGCFWHGHECHRFKWPETRREFWQRKICGNKARDKKTQGNLRTLGWRSMVVWECQLKNSQKPKLDQLIDKCADFLMRAV
ncbi:very short patch repair endonuclease [Hyphomicrobium sp.]|uniref:very short patch repair endonuclease n=1 Tax=Hyphomicrobium sp. TaxID=82 RepID=UPI001E0D9F39|nr:very short patch repair endonuclease [Hyphomicrobium sp.]MBY0558847.1 very short patch repair endonuclease [Hyphomicrobium sp.]